MPANLTTEAEPGGSGTSVGRWRGDALGPLEIKGGREEILSLSFNKKSISVS